MNQEENSGRAARLRAMAHEMLALANELENKYTLRKGTISAFEFASLQALAACASKEFVDRQRRQKSFDAELFGEPCCRRKAVPATAASPSSRSRPMAWCACHPVLHGSYVPISPGSKASTT